MLKNHMSTCKKTHVNMQHLFLMLTPCHPESSHCQESFRNPPAIHAVGAQGPRQTPEQQPRKSHLTTTQPKCPSMSDSAPQADTMPSGPTRSHTPPLRPAVSRTTSGLRPPTVPGTASRHPGSRSDSRRQSTRHPRPPRAGMGPVRNPVL